MSGKDESILNLLVECPWWVSVLVSGIAFVFLRYILPSIDFKSMAANSFAKGISRWGPNCCPCSFVTRPDLRSQLMEEKETGLMKTSSVPGTCSGRTTSLGYDWKASTSIYLYILLYCSSTRKIL